MPIKNTTIPIKFNNRFEYNGIELDSVDIGSLTTAPLSYLKNNKVRLTDEDIILNGVGLYNDPDNVYNTMYAKSLDDGIARWLKDPNKRIIIYPNELGRLLAVRIVSNPPEKPLLVSKLTTTKLFEKLKTTEPKSTLVKKPIPIPEDMKKGLVKVEGGIPYYELDGDPEEIAKLIEEYMKTNTARNNTYIDTPTTTSRTGTEGLQLNNTSKSTTDQAKTDAEDVYFRTNNTRTLPIVNVKQGDEGSYLYKYPHRRVSIYKVSPELAKYILDNLSNNTQSQGLESENFIYSTVPLKNLPNGELNDTIFHDIFTVPSNSPYFGIFEDGKEHSTIYLFAHEAVGSGYHTDENKPVTLIEDYGMINNNEIPIEGNKVFVPQYYMLDGKPWKYHAYYLPYTDYRLSKEYQLKFDELYDPDNFVTDIHGKKHWMGYPTSEYDYFFDQLRNLIPIQSYQAVKDSLDQVTRSRTYNDTSGVSGFFRRLIGRNVSGGKLNYLNLMNHGR